MERKVAPAIIGMVGALIAADSLLSGDLVRRACIFLTGALLTGAAAGKDALARTGSANAVELEANTLNTLAAANADLKTLITPTP
jgi:hypothetical protein